MNKLQRIIATLLSVGGIVAGSHATTGLYTPAPSFAMSDHTVSTSFFHWYLSTSGQISGPWLPLEGRPAWTGEPDWWKGQIKQTMMANIDILYVHLIPNHMEQQRINLFTALNQLRNEGYDVPKVAPFLDTIITWNLLPEDNDMATSAGRDKFVDQYIRFFNQYYSVNQDAYADDYIAKYDDRVILDSWHPTPLDNLFALTRTDVMTRLQAEFGAHSIFSNDIYMVTTVVPIRNYGFADEKVPQFEIHAYFSDHLFNGIKTTQVKPGYWDQNIRNPGYLLPRDGGIHYTAAWNSVAADSGLSRVYVESFNEYDEGSGIYAVSTARSPWIKPESGNTTNDTWSSTDDPLEYLKTTAAGAAAFNSTPNHDAKILWHDFPDYMYTGSTQVVSVVVRNAGDASWTGAENYKFGDKADNDAVFGLTRYLINDYADEILLYGGIFRGRPKTFQLTLIAPTTRGIYEARWSMIQEGVEWFGEELAHTITVFTEGGVIPASVTFGDLIQTWDGSAKPVSITTSPEELAVEVTYDGSSNAPSDEGDYTVISTVVQPGYDGAATNTLVIQRIETDVILGNLQQAWDGSPKTISVQTVPAGIAVELTYNGSTVTPADPGIYTVIGTITQPGYAGAVTNSFSIEPPAAFNTWKAEWFSPEQQTNAAVSAPHIYFDGDDLNNWQEYLAGTDPTNGLSFPSIDLEPTAADEYALSWSSTSGRVYAVEWSPDLTQEFAPLAENLLWPQSNFIDQVYPVSTQGFYRMNISLLDTVTNATITPGIAAYGVGTDLFQGATVTDHSPMHPAADGFLAEDMFSAGAELHSVDSIFADTARTFDFVEFHISNAVHLSHIRIGLINDHIEGADNDSRSVSHIRVYASSTAETVQDNLIADLPIDPEYTTAYGSSNVLAGHSQNVSGLRYFRVEFTRSNPASGPRIMEIDGYGTP